VTTNGNTAIVKSDILGILPHHLAALRARGLSDDTIRAAGNQERIGQDPAGDHPRREALVRSSPRRSSSPTRTWRAVTAMHVFGPTCRESPRKAGQV